MERQITAVVLVVLGNGLVKGESGKSRQLEKHPTPHCDLSVTGKATKGMAG